MKIRAASDSAYDLSPAPGFAAGFRERLARTILCGADGPDCGACIVELDLIDTLEVLSRVYGRGFIPSRRDHS